MAFKLIRKTEIMIKLVMIPFAGGSVDSYKEISNYIEHNTNIQCVLYEYPGHGTRIVEELFENVEEVKEDCLEHIRTNVDDSDSLFIFGHSLGALIAYIVTEQLGKEGNKVEGLIVSGMVPPDMKKIENQVFDSNKDFLRNISTLGGIPEEILSDPDAVEFFGEIIKSDYKLYDSIQNKVEYIDVPMLACCGTEDTPFSKDLVSSWEKVTTSRFTIEEFRGDHFFIFNNVRLLRKNIIDFIEGVYYEGR